jgi:hypothetical protein
MATIDEVSSQVTAVTIDNKKPAVSPAARFLVCTAIENLLQPGQFDITPILDITTTPVLRPFPSQFQLQSSETTSNTRYLHSCSSSDLGCGVQLCCSCPVTDFSALVVSAQTTPYLIRSLSPDFANTNTNTQSITTSPVCTLFAWFFSLLVSALLLEAYSLDQ